MNHVGKTGARRKRRNRNGVRETRRFVALLLVFFLAVAGIPEILTGVGSQELAFAATDTMEDGMGTIFDPYAQGAETGLPTGGVLPCEIREISEEDVPEDIPVYGGSAVYSLREAQSDVRAGAGYRYGYGHLSEAQKKFYDDCLAGIAQFLAGKYKTDDFTGTGDYAQAFGVKYSGLKGSDLFAAYYCLRDDYPEYYWLSNYSSYFGDTFYINIDKEYFKASVRNATEAAIAEGMQEYVAALQGISDDYEKLRTIHDKLINDVEYAYVQGSSSRPEDALWAHSIAGVFDGHNKVVCEGYAKTLQLILNQAGIENVYMVGTADGGAHAWNGVKIGEQWFYVDATWDDAGANFFEDTGLLYLYFCIPASVFTKNHKVNTPSSKEWLYAIPSMSESKDCTFYTKYNCDFTKTASVEDAKSKLDVAGKSVPGSYIHALVSQSTQGYFRSAVSGKYAGVVAPDGNTVYLLDATQYKVLHPAIKIELDKTELEINRDESKTAVLTATLTAADGVCDDVVRWSSSSKCVTITPGKDGKSATLTAKRNGTAVITATAAAGKMSVSCTVTVTGTAEYENIYLDAAGTIVPDEDDFMVWVNGGNVGATKDTKYNYKVRSLYTDIQASQITTFDSKGREKKKNGKLVAGITLSEEEPTLEKGKIVDKEAAKIAKATVNVKTGLVKVTAQKQTGEVYLWVIDTGDEHNVAYAKITVTAAPAKILLNDADYGVGGRTVVKKQTLAIGESMDVFLEPLLASKGTDIAQGGSYSVTYGKNGENYVSVEPIPGSEYGFQITPVALDAAKAGKTLNVKVNFVCNENNKKASISITVTNPMETIAYEAGNGLTMAADDTFTVKYSGTQAQELTLNFTAQETDTGYGTTDKPKIYALSAPNSLTVNEKGKPVVTKPTGAAAKLKASFSRDKKSIVIKVPKGLGVGTKAYFALYYNEDCYKVWSVEVVE